MASTTSNLGLFITDIADLFKDLIDHLKANFLKIDSLYHVGRIIMTEDANWDPNKEIGGRWVRLTNVFLVGAGGNYPVGSTGGRASHYHRTAMGFDGRNFFGWMGRGNDNAGIPYFGSENMNGMNSLTSVDSAVYVNRDNVVRIAYTETESSLPPYEAVFIWKRTG